MKVVAYISSTSSNELEQLKEIQKQKIDVIEYCKKMSYKLLECKQEFVAKTNHEILFNLLAQSSSFDKIIFYSKNVFDDDDEFRTWLFNELNSKNIRYDFVYSDEVCADDEDKLEHKKRLLKKIQNVASLPTLVTNVLKLVKNEKSSAIQLAKIIKYDLGLTSKILRLVNSSFYGFPKEISSIQHGITILGFNTIKGLVISSSISANFKNVAAVGNFNYLDFWLHTTLCATLCVELYERNGEYIGHTDEDEVFSAAILHDVGKLILNQHDAENYQKVIREMNVGVDFESLLRYEKKHCMLSHDEVGQIVVEAWNLPEVIAQCCAYHHKPLEASARYQNIVYVLYLSNILATLILTQQKPKIEMFDSKVLDVCHVNYEMIIDKYNEFIFNPAKLEELRSFFK
ncbi:HDOD domain-containing protein [bacterium]|nr:HDOD domain-containing protein [bacterium]